MMELSNRTLGDWLEHWAETTPDKEYIVYSDRNLRFTWSKFNERVDNMAKGLLSIGVERGTHVGIWAGNVPDWLTFLYACAKIGAVAVTVNKDVADFFNVKLNDVHAENCRKYVHKGDGGSVSGSVHLSKWGDEKRYSSLSIDRARIEFFGKRDNPTGVPETDEPRVRVMDEEDVPDFVKSNNGFEEVDDEDMPFF